MSVEMFNSNVFVNNLIEGQLKSMAMEFGVRLIYECANLYGFSADEAIRTLNITSLKLEKKSVAKKSPSAKKAKTAKASFPMPFNGVAMEGCCGGLRFNRGLYTQCQGKPLETGFCKGCQAQADKNGNGKPDCGTIADRLAVGLYEFRDPKGKAPIAFMTLLKKLKLTEEAVQEEAGKLNLNINPEHFEYIAIEKKKGLKKASEPKEKKNKGRPKKSKKILEVEGESSDLFASLVAQANSETASEPDDEDDELIIESKPSKGKVSDEDKEAKRKAKEAEKEAKRIAAEIEKAKKEAEKEAKRLEEKAKKEAEKEAKRLAAEAEKEAKRKALEEEKEAKRLAAEAEKAKKLEEKKAKKETEKKSSPASSPKKEKASAANDEPDVVKRFEFEGKKYLKSKKTGIIYNMEQDVIGKWNEETQKIEFYEDGSDEEEEEGYESE